MTYNVSVISVNRLFPTKFISTAYGVVNMFAHIFACLSALIAEVPNPYPFLIFESLIVVAMFATFKIKEVKNLVVKGEEDEDEGGVADAEEEMNLNKQKREPSEETIEIDPED
jgi:hypothetical protein